MLRRTHYAREALGLEAINPGPVVREFAVRVPDLDGLFERARAAGVNPGYRLGRDYPEYEDGLLVAITERRTKAQIDRLAARRSAASAREGDAHERRGTLDRPRRRADTLTIFERSRRGPPRLHARRRLDVPEVPDRRAAARLGAPRARRPSCPRSPSPSSCATTRRSRRRTSTSTRASTRSARAR